jgi:dolichyl-phosphate-mannose--protein O-mannosyl transferase
LASPICAGAEVQRQAVSTALLLLALYCIVCSAKRQRNVDAWLIAAWCALAAASVLEPWISSVVPIACIYVAGNPRRRKVLMFSSGIAVLPALATALAAAGLSHGWTCSSVACRASSALNLWSIRGTPVVPARQDWALPLLAAAIALIGWRYARERTTRALLEASAVVMLGCAVLGPRMRECFFVTALVPMLVCARYSRRYVYATIVLIAVVCCAALQPSRVAVAALSMVTVAIFFWLGYAFLETEATDSTAKAPRDRHHPPEGLTPFAARDYVVMAAFGVCSFVLSFVGYWRPQGTSCWTIGGQSRCGIFDELYFARAGEEYLLNLRIYENTHPPLSKLLVTLSMMLFGGMRGHGLGDTTYAWRFLDVVFGALVVMLLYALAKRMTGSTAIAAMASLLLTADGMHFVQSRIATPEGFVVFFATLATYAFYRFWIASQTVAPPKTSVPWWGYPAGVAASLFAGIAVASACVALWHFDRAAAVVAMLYVACACYLAVQYFAFARWFGNRPLERSLPDGSTAPLWLLLFAVSLGLLVATKWYGVMAFGVSFLVLVASFTRARLRAYGAARHGNPRVWRLDAVLVTIVFVSATVYALAWVPDLLRHSPDPNEIHTVNDVVERQYSMFHYHDVLVAKATHPYSSKWWEWPLDLVPTAYFYQDRRSDPSDPTACCVYEITSMPNPIVLWFGLFSVPWVAVLAWMERVKAYALIVLTYLLQWLPWMKSPRITFAYHFYVDIPLICLCNAVVLHRLWRWALAEERLAVRRIGQAFVISYIALAVGAFVYFYPILSAQPIAWSGWHQRMWFPTWIIGPG